MTCLLAQRDACDWVGFSTKVRPPVGVYHWDRSRIGGEWKVTRMAVEMTKEIGDGTLVEEARARASQ